MKTKKMQGLSALFAIISATATLSVFAQQQFPPIPLNQPAYDHTESCPAEVPGYRSNSTVMMKVPLDYVLISRSYRRNQPTSPATSYTCYYQSKDSNAPSNPTLRNYDVGQMGQSAQQGQPQQPSMQFFVVESSTSNWKDLGSGISRCNAGVDKAPCNIQVWRYK